jgi:cytidyltransferase-like protein
MNEPKIVAVSGGFDPLHIGHVRLLKEARALGDRLVVIMNNDNWLMKKKGFVFMPEAERVEILSEFPFVDEVIISCHLPDDTDRSVVRDLRALRPHIFANGGDRDPVDAANPNSSLNADQQLCQELGIEIVYGMGKGGKVQSSSWLTDNLKKHEARETEA